MTISYAQQFEDVMLWRALKDVKNGAYIDIGANDPVVDSVSLLFYEKGWRGLHVEPMPAFAEKLRQLRPDESVIEAVVGNTEGSVTLFSFEGTGLTTAVPEHAQRHEEGGRDARLLKSECLPLHEIFDRFNRRHVHWLKVDVEGMEAVVLESWGSHPTRPWIVVVESTLPNSQEPAFEEWEHELTGRDYEFVYFDGLNRFYVHAERAELKSAFSVPPNFFDFFLLSEHSPFGGHITGKVREAETQVARLEEKVAELTASGNALQTALDAEREALGEAISEGTLLRETLDARILELDAALQDRDALRKTLDGHIRDLDAALQHRDAHIARIEAEWNLTRSDLEERQALLNTELLASREETRQAIVRAEQQVVREIHAREHQAASFQRELDHWQNEVKAYRDQVEAMRASASWRLSAPIRWAGRSVRLARTGLKVCVRPVLASGLWVVRANPWMKRPILAFASLIPPLRRKIDHFSMVRLPLKAANDISPDRSWNLTPDTQSVDEWKGLIEPRAPQRRLSS